jgi:hypothetical protein
MNGPMNRVPKIESGIPLPRKGAPSRPHQRKYPVNDLKNAGDSFFVPLPEGGSLFRLQNAVLNAARDQGIKVTSRRIEEEGIPGVRLWRTD